MVVRLLHIADLRRLLHGEVVILNDAFYSEGVRLRLCPEARIAVSAVFEVTTGADTTDYRKGVRVIHEPIPDCTD